MARRPDGHANRVNQQIIGQAAAAIRRQLDGFERIPAQCLDCGHELFDRKMLYQLAYVPEIVCGLEGGGYDKKPVEHYVCAGCGREHATEEWQQAARQAFEQKESKMTIEGMKPDDNGKE